MARTFASTPTLPRYEEALAKVLSAVPEMGAEPVTLGEALGRTLRQAVYADRDLPPFDRSAMDGFAVCREDIDIGSGHSHPVEGSISAGEPVTNVVLAAGTAMRIATGAPLPRRADAVIPIERAMVSLGAGSERVSFTDEAVRPWANVHRQGADAQAGDTLLEPGVLLGPAQLGIAATVGAVELQVSARPRVTVLTTGDEVRDPGTPTSEMASHQIRNSNGPIVLGLLRALGTPPLGHRHLGDQADTTLEAARRALETSDLVLTTGGVSAGQRDYLPWAWEELGVETVLHGVAIQPGKPLFVGRHLDPRAGLTKLVVGLPGNPVSVLTTAHLFVWRILRKMSGLASPSLPWRNVLLAEATKTRSDRQMFRAATLVDGAQARVIPWQGSGDISHTAAANGFVRLPLQHDDAPRGMSVPFLPMVGA